LQIAFLLTCIIFLTFNSLLLKSFAYECPYNGAFLKARLRIKETTQNHLSQWAYYDNENEEWVIVPTINQDGYLTAEINVLAT
jgi:hypothetical protein